uniref:Uncharacterized protein n=1 Tax=Zea mays TaxID=4577 RepID=C4J1E6_MAIZE|nr:unknown [Zea mays]ACR37108.1 unknown [Zea mays]
MYPIRPPRRSNLQQWTFYRKEQNFRVDSCNN